MAVWRRRALELFPSLRRDLTRRDYNVYSLFFDLNFMLHDAFDRGDAIQVSRILTFAEWCAKQTAQPLWNAAAVVFYEHLFDYPEYSERIVPLLSPAAVYLHWGLWERNLDWDAFSPKLQAKRTLGARQAFRSKR